MKKIFFMLLSLIVISLFLTSCAEKISDKELINELDDMSEEEQAAVLADDTALAGQALRTVSSGRVAKVSSIKKSRERSKFGWISCSDSDGGKVYDKYGVVKAEYSSSWGVNKNEYKDTCRDSKVLTEFFCKGKDRYVTTINCEYKCQNGACVEPICGNNIVEPGESCDDGNLISGDGCSKICETESQECGNGIREGTEECDGSDFAGKTCKSYGYNYGVLNCTNCVIDNSGCMKEPICGNNIVEFGEDCDDGNLISGDGCSKSCETESQECGNGIREGTEECDLGNYNGVAGKNCSTQCRLWTGCIEYEKGSVVMESSIGIRLFNATCSGGNAQYKSCITNPISYMNTEIICDAGEICSEGACYTK